VVEILFHFNHSNLQRIYMSLLKINSLE